ncbi:MAG: DUF2845 domain-containing protein [Steroidobacteraceae bacterium]|nr:DUF2845 domain-containing protein [Steroidobacteraceae bacterium]
MKLRFVIALTALSGIFAFPAVADESFRCGKWIASSDMTPAELAEKCGAPTLHESRTEDVLVRNRNTGLMMKTGETRIETWTYERGTQAAPMVVTIVDGRIKSIDRLAK